jgi:hypothetical protein
MKSEIMEAKRIPEIKNIIMEIKKSMNAVEKSGSRKTRNDITEIMRKGGKNPL